MAKVARTVLTDVVASKLAGTSSDKKLTRELAAYLLAEKRVGELDSLARDLINYRASKGLVEVTAVSAFELSQANLVDIEAEVKKLFPAAHEIIINQRLDVSQLAGVRLEFPDKQLDLSVRNKLNQFKQLTAARGA